MLGYAIGCVIRTPWTRDRYHLASSLARTWRQVYRIWPRLFSSRCLRGTVQARSYVFISFAFSWSAAYSGFYPALDANLRKLDLDFIKAHAEMIIDTSPVSYLKNARLHGSLFQDGIDGGAVCSVNTEFFVDHDEPLQTLKRWEERQDMAWPLGELAEGHEFLCIVPSK